MPPHFAFRSSFKSLTSREEPKANPNKPNSIKPIRIIKLSHSAEKQTHREQFLCFHVVTDKKMAKSEEFKCLVAPLLRIGAGNQRPRTPGSPQCRPASPATVYDGVSACEKMVWFGWLSRGAGVCAREATWRSALAARVLAIDFGMKRMGLAVSDALGITAQGLATLQRTRMDDDLRRIQELVKEYEVERVVLGNPIGWSGKETAMSKRVAEFAEKLRRRLSCPVELWDERLTSVEANRMLRESGIGIRKRRNAADRVAVTLLLQGYLDRKSVETKAPGDSEIAP